MAQVTVTTAGTEIYGDDTLIQNLGAGVLYVCAPDAAGGTGIRVKPGQAIRLSAVAQVRLITLSGTADVRYMAGAEAITGAVD